MARQPLTPVTETTLIRSECLLDPDTRQRGVDTYANSADNAQRVQFPATASHHREVVSRGGQDGFVRPSDGCADAEEPVAEPHPANACRPPSAPCGVDAGPTSWTTIPAWQHLVIGVYLILNIWVLIAVVLLSSVKRMDLHHGLITAYVRFRLMSVFLQLILSMILRARTIFYGSPLVPW